MNKIHFQPDSADTLVIMVSPAAVPENFDILSRAGSTTEEIEKSLCRCISRFCQIADKGDYVPDNMIHVYKYNPDAHLENKFWQFTTNRESICDFVDFKEVQASLHIPLRMAYYVYLGCKGIHSMEELQISPDTILPDMGSSLQEYINSCYSVDRRSPWYIPLEVSVRIRAHYISVRMVLGESACKIICRTLPIVISIRKTAT